MITHLLDLFHLITSFTDDKDRAPDYPEQPSFAHSNPHQVSQFLSQLDEYQRSLHHRHNLVLLTRFSQEEKERRNKKMRWFYLMLSVNGLNLSAKKALHKQQEEYHLLHMWLILGKYFNMLFYFAFFLLPSPLWRINHLLKNPVFYQAPLTEHDQLRHTQALHVSLQKCQHTIAAQIKHPTLAQNQAVSLDYLHLLHAVYGNNHMTATMKDGTVITHGLDADAQTYLTITHPEDTPLSLDEQSNMRGDFLAMLLFQKYLLHIPDHHHADFWRPTSHALSLNMEMPPVPYHGMTQEHRIICRTLYHLVHLGLEPILHGAPLTQARMMQEHWSDALFSPPSPSHTPPAIMTDTIDQPECSTCLEPHCP